MAVSRVAAFGDNCVDRYLPPVGADHAGGNALNVAAGLALLGHPAAYLGAVGEDADGAFVLEQAAAAGVDTSRVRTGPGRTGVTTIRVTDAGERVFVSEAFGTSAAYAPGPDDLAFLSQRGWVHAAGPADPLPAMMHLADAGVRLSYDFAHPTRLDRLAAVAPLLEVAFLSAPAADEEAATALARKAVEGGARIAVVGRGRAGSLLLADAEPVVQAAILTRVVDTLGAGDALIAGVVSGLVDGMPYAAALLRGAQAAAVTCSHVGAWSPASRMEAHA